jgi:hypothetical protein
MLRNDAVVANINAETVVRLRKVKKTFRQLSRPRGRDSNPPVPEYEARMLTIQ